jgi:hypothetical protein
MNPGAVEEAGKVAGGFIDSMKSQPLALALIVLNVIFLLIFWFIFDRASHRNQERETQLYATLAKCVESSNRQER